MINTHLEWIPMVRLRPFGLRLVRAEGLEPTRLAALEPKSSASANSATPAKPKGLYIGKMPVRRNIFMWNKMSIWLTRNIMTYTEAFGVLSTLMTLLSRANYFNGIFRGKVHPHAFSWFIWGIISAVGFAAQLSQGAGPGSWSRGFGCFTAFIIVIVSVMKVEHNIKRSDWVTLAIALCTIPLWMITKTPVWSVILVCLIDALGCYPTLRKSWNKPYDEAAKSYMFSGIGSFFSIIALENYTVSTWLYPLEGMCANIAIVICLLLRRKHARKPVAGVFLD